MLHVEQPDACHRCEIVRQSIDHEHSLPVEEPNRGAEHQHDARVGRPDAVDLTRASCSAFRAEALAEHQMERSAKEEQRWVPDNSILQSSPGRSRLIFFYRQRW